MTEPISSHGGVAVADPAAGLLSPELDETPGDDNRRKLAAVAAAVAVLVLLVVAFFLLKGGGSNNATGFVPPHVVPPATGSTTAGTTAHQPAATKPVKLLKSFAGPIGRDPFKPLYVQPAAAAPKGTTTGNGVVTITQTPGVGTGSGTGTTPPVVGTPSSFAPVWIELVTVKGTKSASFVIGYSNGKHSKTAPFADVVAPTHSLRTTFGSVFALLSIQDHTATVQFGDGRPFDLAAGFGNRHFVG